MYPVLSFAAIHILPFNVTPGLAAPVEAHVPVSVPKPEPPKGAKDGSPEDNAGESDSDAGEGGGGKRVGSSRRRRKHSSASEGEIKDR